MTGPRPDAASIEAALARLLATPRRVVQVDLQPWLDARTPDTDKDPDA